MLTMAMRVVGLGYGAVVAVFVAYASQSFAADFIAVIAAFIVLFGAIGLAAVLWTGARRHPWFWLVAMVPGLLALLMSGFYGPYALTHPVDTVAFVTTILSLVGGILIVAGSITAWLEVRRGRPLWSSSGRSGAILAGTAGLVVGACLTAFIGASSTSAGSASGEAPTATGALTAVDTRFSGDLEATAGSVLGVVVTNRDDYPHAFDIDDLGIHVPLPAGATTFVAVKPRTAGSLAFYCSVPGHRDAGMVGAIVVQ